MRTFSLASASVAALALMALYDATPASARGHGCPFRLRRRTQSSSDTLVRRVTTNKTFVKSVKQDEHAAPRGRAQAPLKLAKINKVPTAQPS